MEDKKEYRSSIGIMYVLVALIIAGVLIGVFFLSIRGDGNVVAISIAYIIAIITYCIALIYPIINTKYILEVDRLIINCGIYKNEIAFQEILQVYKKKSLGRQPALSTKMIFIKYKSCEETKLIGISPKDRDEFIQIIQKRINN